jgi:undecaprenyl-diphosphatase
MDVRKIARDLGTLDREVFEAVAESPSPLLDTAMPQLTNAADHSKLWLAIAAALGAVGGPAVRRGTARGVASLAVTSLVTNQVAKRLWRRPRPDHTLIPLARRSRRIPTSHSLPSGHSASAAAFAVGVGLESPPVGLGLALLAGLVGCPGWPPARTIRGDVFAGVGIGAAIAVLGARVVPTIPATGLPTADPLRYHTDPRPDGDGAVLVINPDSGGGTGRRIIDEIRKTLPHTEIVELDADNDVVQVMRDAAARGEVLAVGGGTVATAAGAAVQRPANCGGDRAGTPGSQPALSRAAGARIPVHHGGRAHGAGP